MMDRDSLAEGTAWVTPAGILFRGRYYSCGIALREGWYGRAAEEEPWPVAVLFDQTAEWHEAIYIDSEEYMPAYLCYVLDQSDKPAYAEFYQERIRQLQEERKQLLK